ncbi:unnamed protein product [Hydatigera taeniaeformis]|uniref:NAD(P)-binding protein n=1 Tax=Hydatigena taeniaeformis TaxID=6205 RepID=A0A0R3X9X9_HYDTA|nr:unnamed protein product [Hydatigera taeniaeformis]
MLDSDCEDLLPLDWQTEANEENEVLDACDAVGKYIVLIGGTSGVGKYLAKSLVSRGSIITCLSRSPPPGRWSTFTCASQLPSPSNGSLFWNHLDLSCMQSVFEFAEVIAVNNLIRLVFAAATLPESFENQRSTDGFDRIVQINFLSHVLLTRLLQRRLRETSRSTVVFVTCEALRASDMVEANDVLSALEPSLNSYLDTCGRIKLYANTKFLQILFAAALREFLQRHKVRNPEVFVCSSGNLIWQSKLISSASWTCWWWLKCLRFIAYPLTKNMEFSTATLAFCALHSTIDTHQRRKKDGLYFNGCIPISLPEAAFNPEMKRVTWAHVNALLEGKFKLPSW